MSPESFRIALLVSIPSVHILIPRLFTGLLPPRPSQCHLDYQPQEATRQQQFSRQPQAGCGAICLHKSSLGGTGGAGRHISLVIHFWKHGQDKHEPVARHICKKESSKGIEFGRRENIYIEQQSHEAHMSGKDLFGDKSFRGGGRSRTHTSRTYPFWSSTPPMYRSLFISISNPEQQSSNSPAIIFPLHYLRDTDPIFHRPSPMSQTKNQPIPSSSLCFEPKPSTPITRRWQALKDRRRSI